MALALSATAAAKANEDNFDFYGDYDYSRFFDRPPSSSSSSCVTQITKYPKSILIRFLSFPRLANEGEEDT